MGQEQSSEGGGTGSSSSFSLLKGMGRSIDTNKIVIVKTDTEPKDPTKEPDSIRLAEIPQFLPILRAQLNQTGVKDPPDLFTKLEPGPTLGLTARLSYHFAATAEAVASEQASLSTRIREIDYAVATLANRMRDRERQSTKQVTNELAKSRDLVIGLKKVTAALTSVVPSLQAANLALPSDLRLPTLDLSLPPPPTPASMEAIEPVTETMVMDEPGTS